MPPKKQSLCEIIFGQLRIPVSDKEQGKKVIEGIFMIGEPGRAETRPKVGKRGRRKAKRVKVIVKRRKSRAVSEGKAPGFGARQIRSLRKKLGISEKEFAALVGVNRATVNKWEGGKFKPKEEKVRQLAALAGTSKEEVKKMLAGKMPKQPQGKNHEEVQAKNPNSKKGSNPRRSNRSKK